MKITSEKIHREPPPGGADIKAAEHAVPKNLRFTPELEHAFREQYARKILPGLRGGLLLQLVIFLLQGAGLFSGALALTPPLAGVVILLALLLASLHPRFPVVWQPSIPRVHVSLIG